MADKPIRDAAAPAKFGGMFLCGCTPTRTYCSRVEGDCPWWDREPIEPDWQAAAKSEDRDG